MAERNVLAGRLLLGRSIFSSSHNPFIFLAIVISLLKAPLHFLVVFYALKRDYLEDLSAPIVASRLSLPSHSNNIILTFII